jgi:hypothetical protein
VAEKSETVRLSIEELNLMLSKILSYRNSESAHQGSCPSIETLAALIDCKVNRSEQRNLLVHLASCQDCYDTVSETILIERQWKAEEGTINTPATEKISIAWRLIRTAITIGAAAVLIFVLYHAISPVPEKRDVVVHQKEDRQPPTESAINIEFHPYIHQAKKYRVSGDSEIVSSQSYAFSAGHSFSITAFRSGVLLIQLEAALGNNQDEIAKKTADLLVLTLTQAGTKTEVTDLYQNISNQNSKESLTKYLGQHKAVEEFLQSKGQFTMMRFGEWLECSLLAETSNDPQFLQSDDIQIFKNQLSLHSLPRGVSANLNEIDKILRDKNQKRSRLIRLLQDTIEILWESA